MESALYAFLFTCYKMIKMFRCLGRVWGEGAGRIWGEGTHKKILASKGGGGKPKNIWSVKGGGARLKLQLYLLLSAVLYINKLNFYSLLFVFLGLSKKLGL